LPVFISFGSGWPWLEICKATTKETYKAQVNKMQNNTLVLDIFFLGALEWVLLLVFLLSERN